MTGIDLVRISRIALALKRGNFLDGAFTENEREYYYAKGEKIQTLAGMFAAKEAVVKALGTGFTEIRPLDIEICHNALGAPNARLSQRARQKTGVAEMEVSITHEGDFAFAVAGPDCATVSVDASPYLEYAATADCEPQLWLRQLLSHKGNYGRVYVIGGSPQMTGAPLMCASAALAAGAGLVTLCVPDSLKEVYQKQTLQNTLMFMPDTEGKIVFDEKVLESICLKADVVVIGMGMGDNPELCRIIGYLAKKDIVLLVDADGLNATAKEPSCLYDHRCRLILSPHIGEFDRLGKGVGDNRDIGELARKFSAVIMKKSAVTEINDGTNGIKTTCGTPALAKGGSGDILAGITAALCGCLTPAEACLKACRVLGRAAANAEAQVGENSVTAKLLLENIIV